MLPAGPGDPALLIVGLAPGMHGANRTGMPFTGDASGELLFRVLDETDLTDRVRITNAVKCLPVRNLPSATEIRNCSRFLVDELRDHAPTVVLALGGVAHRAIIAALGLRQADYPFGHGHTHTLPEFVLVDSYHCSRYNTQTGRLTHAMFLEVIRQAGSLARP